MKTINLLLVAALTLFILPVFADSTSSKPTSTLANQTASIAKSTLSMAQDTAITTYIYAKLASHPDLSNANLDISTNEGKVVLNGIVNDDSQAKEIRQVAESTSGVKSVDASKIIVSQEDSSIYVKTSSTPSVPETAQPINQSAEPVAQPEMQLSSTDPLLTNPGDKLNKENAPSVKMKKQMKTVQLSKTTHKPKSHAASKHKKKKKKKTPPAIKTAKQKHKIKKQLLQGKALTHHHKKTKTKALVQHHPKKSEKHLAKQKPALEKLKKPQVVSRKNSDESVEQMTNNFLKTALMANKSIPEE